MLALPILLSIMALMVNFAVAASWKVRAAGVARHMFWSSHDPLNREPAYGHWRAAALPAQWRRVAAPVGADAEHRLAGAEDHPTFPHETMDRPEILLGEEIGVVLPPPPGSDGAAIIVNDSGEGVFGRPFFTGKGYRGGRARVGRPFPMLSSLDAYELSATCPSLLDCWRYDETGYGSNASRRTPVHFTLPQTEGSAQQNWLDLYRRTALALEEAHRVVDMDRTAGIDPPPTVRSPAAYVVDGDLDHREIANAVALVLGGGGGGSPDYHPGLSSFCSLDRDAVREELVEHLIYTIKGGIRDVDGIPYSYQNWLYARLGRGFEDMYERSIAVFEALLDRTDDPSHIAYLNAMIAEFTLKLEQTRRFRAQIPPGSLE